MADSNKLRFYQSYGNIDIWQDLDTMSGKECYTFWFNGKSYERETHGEIIALAKYLTDRQRG